MSKVDTQVRDVTKPGANLFAELGFTPEEARRYQAESKALIGQMLKLKEQLMDELASWIDEHHLKQADAAEILHVTRPRVSDVVNKKASKFTIDSLIEMLTWVGKPVRVVVGLSIVAQPSTAFPLCKASRIAIPILVASRASSSVSRPICHRAGMHPRSARRTSVCTRCACHAGPRFLRGWPADSFPLTTRPTCR